MADKQLSALTAASALADADLFYVMQGGNSRKATGTQVRAFGGWRALGGAYAAAGVWDFSADGAVSSAAFTGLSGANDILVIARGVTCSVSSQLLLRLSTDNGSTYYNTSGNYSSVAADGQLTAATGLFITSTSATAARSAQAVLRAVGVSGPAKACSLLNRGVQFEFTGSFSPINAIRVEPSGGGNFTGGSIYCLVC